MGLETASYISELVATNPTSSDPKSQGDNHLRLIKGVLQTQFPNFGTNAVTATAAEINYTVGVTSGIQAQLNAKAPLASPTFTGTVTIPSGALIDGYAPLLSPALTGTPTAPTATTGTSTTQIATTAFVTAASFQAALPGQTGNAGKFVTTDGTNASWAEAVTPAGTQTLTNKTISGASNTLTVDGSNGVGFRDVPQNSQSTAYTAVLTDAGKHLLHPSADTTARTFTIPANSSVAYPIGTAITFVNQNGAGVMTISITSDTMRLAGLGTTGSRTLAANGVATALKLTSTEWIISGTGLT